MTWAEACTAMVAGKRVRLPQSDYLTGINGYPSVFIMDTTTLTDGNRAFAPEMAHVLSQAWEIAE